MVIQWVGEESVWYKWVCQRVEFKTDALMTLCAWWGDEWGVAEARGSSLKVLWNPKAGEIAPDCKHIRGLFIGSTDTVTFYHLLPSLRLSSLGIWHLLVPLINSDG